jgi:hypothetical protein
MSNFEARDLNLNYTIDGGQNYWELKEDYSGKPEERLITRPDIMSSTDGDQISMMMFLFSQKRFPGFLAEL